MTTYTTDDLKKILDLHRKYLYGEDGGSGANLSRADLSGAVLRGAVLRGANLRDADLSGANLRDAVLSRADLSGADLSDADLSGADLSGANLSGANLSGAVLRDAVLRGADLSGANLRDAVLSDGVTWEEYLKEIVPALLCAGGKPLAAVATAETWACHSWQNCPMALAFDVHSPESVPALHRGQAQRFVQFFDAGLIPLPTVSA